jgi:SAM-dependent methyltransferase
VDIDADVVRHANEKYGSPNLQFLAGSMTAVPITADHSFDACVCFEAIEHIEDQEALLREVKRLLKPDGTFIVSTPNKAIYHDESPEENPFHVKELYFEEFQTLLARYFRNVRFLGQRIHPGSSIWPIGAAGANGFQEFVMDKDKAEFEFVGAEKRVPLYFIAVASDSALTLASSGSVLVDESDSLIAEKDQETRWREEQLVVRDQTIASLEEAVQWRQGQIDELSKGLEWTQQRAGDLEKTVASNEDALKWRAQQVNDLETAKEYWQGHSTLLTRQLQDTQRQLAEAEHTLAGIYASRGWKFIVKLRNIRDRLTGRGKSRG